MSEVRVCWLWTTLFLASGIGLPILSMINKHVFIVSLIASVSLLIATIPFMISYVATSIRMGRPFSVPRRSALLRHVRSDASVFVGEGWSFWLNYTKPVASRRIVSMSRSYAGVLNVTPSRVVCRSGTRLDDLQSVLSRHGLTLRDRSQLDDMSVGGAVKTAAHGCCAQVWFMQLVEAFTYAVQGEGRLLRVEDGDPEFGELAARSDVVVFDITIRVVQNHGVLLLNRECADPVDFDWDQYSMAQYRMLFVNSSGVYARIGFASNQTWYSQGQPPLRLEYARKSIRLRRQYSRRVLLSEVHSYVSHIDIVEALMIPLLKYINIEFFVANVSISRVTLALKRYHALYSGRTEVRELCTRGIAALDVAIHCPNKDEAIGAFLRMLYDMGVRRTAIHRGKYRLMDAKPLHLVHWDSL